MPQQDFRARLQPKDPSAAKDILGANDSGNILFPLYSTRGVLFPYTPTITSGYIAEYDNTPFVHTNYGYNAYVRSYPKSIGIATEFTAQTDTEAQYLLAVLHFFKSVTKSYFGVNPYSKAGTPPPVLLFNYLGDYQFNNVPVLVKDFSYTYDATVDYVPVNTNSAGSVLVENKRIYLPKGGSGYTWVPTHISVTIELDTQYTPIQLRNEFNLDAFRSGQLINKGYI